MGTTHCCQVCEEKPIPELTAVHSGETGAEECGAGSELQIVQSGRSGSHLQPTPAAGSRGSRRSVDGQEVPANEAAVQGASASQADFTRSPLSGRVKESSDFEFTVALPTRGAKMGMVFGISNSQRGQVRVRGLKENGFVESWNRQNPAEAIEVGDQIVSINGATSAQDMITVVSRNPEEIQIRVRRAAKSKPPG